jgi:hypothetical protein
MTHNDLPDSPEKRRRHPAERTPREPHAGTPDHLLPGEGGPAHAGAPELEPHLVPEEPSPPAAAAQPTAGLIGLAVVAAGFVVLGIVPGGPQTALETVGPIATFVLPILAASALWWEGWPAHRLRQPLAGAVNLILMVAAGILLTILAQAVVGRVDVGGIFSTVAKGGTTFPTWPWVMPLGVLVFVATLQITFVNGRWPLTGMDGRVAGFAVVAVSWVVGLVVFFLVLNWDFVPAPARRAIGLRDPGGPVNGLDLLGWLAVVTAFQVLFYIGLGGWPTVYLRRPVVRLIAANVFVIGGGWLTWAVLFHGFGLATPTVAAIGASVAAAAVLSEIVFDNWPVSSLRGGAGGLAFVAIQVAVLTACLFYGLRALGLALQTWDRDPVELWVTVSDLNFIAATAIAHVAVFHRWPVRVPRGA